MSFDRPRSCVHRLDRHRDVAFAAILIAGMFRQRMRIFRSSRSVAVSANPIGAASEAGGTDNIAIWVYEGGAGGEVRR